MAFVFITLAIFSSTTSSADTITVNGVEYTRVNPWYRKVLYEGEEGTIECGPPVGHREKQLPGGAEKVDFDGGTYYYASGAFWQATGEGDYVVVTPPVGAQVYSLPEKVKTYTEGDVTLHQFDMLYLSETTDDAGKKAYQVEPTPAEEEIDSIPSGSPSFVADEETFYYVDYNFYVEYEENGKRGYVNGEPDIGAQLDTLPSQATEIEYEDEPYFQWDTVFFEQVEGEDGSMFYEVVDSPGEESETIEN